MTLYNWLNNTMVIERITGVGVYTLALVVVCLLLINARTSRRVSFILNTYLIALCVMAFCYIPGPDEDLWRIRAYAASWLKQDFGTFFQYNVINSANPTANLFIYACSMTGIDGFLPMACALVYYGNALYIFKDLYNRQRYSARSLSIALFFLMATGNFLQIISNVRTFAAMSVVARCVYDETINNKPIIRNALWYCVAALTHSIVLVICVLRFFMLLFSRTQTIRKKIRNIFITMAIFVFVYALGRDYIDAAIYKAMKYLTGDAYSFAWSYWISGILTFVVVCTCFGRHQNISDGLKNMRGYVLLIIAIACIFSFEYSIFHRLTLFASLLVIPYLGKRIDSSKNTGFSIFVFICSLVMLAISVTRGNLSGYKFFLMS